MVITRNKIKRQIINTDNLPLQKLFAFVKVENEMFFSRMQIPQVRTESVVNMEQQVFKENPIKRILIYVVGFIPVFVFTTIFMADKSLEIYYWVINIFVFAICLLLIIFEEDTTIICDEVGCTMKKKRFWQNSGKIYDFKWNEVSGTEYSADAESSREFYIEIDGMKRKFLTSHTSLDNFDYFISTVNYATPHLSYFWEKQDGWVSNNFEGRRYKKVAR